MILTFIPEDKLHQHRHERATEDIAGKDREDDCQGHRREQKSGRADQKDDRDKDDADRQSGYERRHGNFA